jgi:ribonuclease PH
MKKSPSALRPLKFQKNYLPHAEGSCLVTMGETQVLCVATIEDKVPPHAEEKGTGWIHAEYAMLPRSGETRSARGKVTSGGRVQEISRLVGRSLRAAVDLKELGPKTITIDCDVLRADGGTRTASINGGFVALVQALLLMRKKKELLNWPLKHFVGAVSVGVIKGKPILDICYSEDKEADTDLNVVMTGPGRLIEVQGTAEGNPFSTGDLNKMLLLARMGIGLITRAQKKVLGALP